MWFIEALGRIYRWAARVNPPKEGPRADKEKEIYEDELRRRREERESRVLLDRPKDSKR